MRGFTKNNQKNAGDWAELTAKTYLEQQGLTFLAKNFNTRLGEIDLIFKTDDTIVFVEVKQRANQRFMHPFESIPYSKQIKIKRTAELYMQHTERRLAQSMRFDVLTLLGNPPLPKIEWTQNAF